MAGRLLGHFRIGEQIGRGGMGVVYRARDEQLHRDVAIKVLPESTLGDEHVRRRFRAEARSISSLNHPNIATVHEFGDESGFHYLVMEYVPGESLDVLLARGKMPGEEVLRLGEQLAAALVAAHQHGIVHRDLKPGNLRITPDGWLKVLDFGLAKTLATADDATFSRTVAASDGFSGTLPYMAPEQLRGEPSDARTDIWAAGVVLYEMATGRRPFTGQTSSGVSADIIHQEPPPPQTFAPGLSSALQSIILRCLRKKAELRWQRAEELLEAIRNARTSLQPRASRRTRRLTRWAVAVTVLLVLAVAAGLVRFWPGRAHRDTIRAIAVMPLANLSADASEQYLADGLTEALTTNLAQIRALRVASRTSVMTYRENPKSVEEIGRDLQVDGVVEGAVQRQGDRLRITANLIHAATDAHLWGQTYEREIKDILQLQKEVARSIAREIRVVVTPEEEQALAHARQVDAAAHESYLRGRFHWNKRTEEDLKKAIGFYQDAIARDPAYAAPYSGLADAYLTLFDYGVLSLDETTTRVRAAAERALDLDERLAEAHNSLAHLDLHQWRWEEAEARFRRALELDPSYAPTYHWYALCLTAIGRLEEAVIQMRKAQQLDPVSVRINADLGMALYAAGHFDEAIAQEERTLALDPKARVAHWIMGMAYEQQGRTQQAIEKYEQALKLAPGNPNYMAALGHAYGRSGRRDAARKLLSELKKAPAGEPVPAFFIALVHVGLSEHETAIDWLERAVADRSGSVRYLKVERRLEPVRQHPRYRALMAKLRLAD